MRGGRGARGRRKTPAAPAAPVPGRRRCPLRPRRQRAAVRRTRGRRPPAGPPRSFRSICSRRRRPPPLPSRRPRRWRAGRGAAGARAGAGADDEAGARRRRFLASVLAYCSLFPGEKKKRLKIGGAGGGGGAAAAAGAGGVPRGPGRPKGAKNKRPASGLAAPLGPPRTVQRTDGAAAPPGAGMLPVATMNVAGHPAVARPQMPVPMPPRGRRR